MNARPFTFPFQPEKAALVVIDMQRDFLEPGGFGAHLGNDVSLLSGIVGTLDQLLTAWRSKGLPVIHTQECHKPDLSDLPHAKRYRAPNGLRIGDAGPMGRLLVCGEPGSDFIDACRPLPGERVYAKPGKGAFYATTLHEDLLKAGVTQLVITGVTTEVCVQTTMREANDRGYDCVLVEDATASYFPEFKQAVLEMVRAQQAIIGWTALAQDVVDALG